MLLFFFVSVVVCVFCLIVAFLYSEIYCTAQCMAQCDKMSSNNRGTRDRTKMLKFRRRRKSEAIVCCMLRYVRGKRGVKGRGVDIAGRG